MTYEVHDDGSKEIVEVTLSKYNNSGLHDIMIQVVLFDNTKKVGHINVEMYDPLVSNKRTCYTFLIALADATRRIYSCFKNSYRAIYDDRLKIIDCEDLVNGKMSQITL